MEVKGAPFPASLNTSTSVQIKFYNNYYYVVTYHHEFLVFINFIKSYLAIGQGEWF